MKRWTPPCPPNSNKRLAWSRLKCMRSTPKPAQSIPQATSPAPLIYKGIPSYHSCGKGNKKLGYQCHVPIFGLLDSKDTSVFWHHLLISAEPSHMFKCVINYGSAMEVSGFVFVPLFVSTSVKKTLILNSLSQIVKSMCTHVCM